MVYLRPPTVPLSTTQDRRSVQQCPRRSPDCSHDSACRINPGQGSSTGRSGAVFGQVPHIWGSSRPPRPLCDRLSYACPPDAKTSGSAANKVFLYCRAAPAARGPSPLAVGLIESHGAGASGSPGRDARMPPGLEERAPGMAGCRPGACGPRAIRAGRRTPARDHPAGPGSDRRPDAPERRGEAGRRGPGSPGYRRVRLPGASRPVPALRSATREARKNAHTPADLGGWEKRPR